MLVFALVAVLLVQAAQIIGAQSPTALLDIDLLRGLVGDTRYGHVWRLRVLLPPHLRAAQKACLAACLQELASPLRPAVIVPGHGPLTDCAGLLGAGLLRAGPGNGEVSPRHAFRQSQLVERPR